MTEADPDAIEREVRVEATPETVFSYLVDPERLIRWMGQDATLEAHPGGTFCLRYRSGDVVSGSVVEVVAPERLVVTWGWEAPGDATPPGSSRVEFQVVPDRSGSIVRLRHSGLVPEARAGHVEGWDAFLPGLAEAVVAA
jgi:uncharacterized protein YndB with AHSA1/START domain